MVVGVDRGQQAAVGARLGAVALGAQGRQGLAVDPLPLGLGERGLAEQVDGQVQAGCEQCLQAAERDERRRPSRSSSARLVPMASAARAI